MCDVRVVRFESAIWWIIARCHRSGGMEKDGWRRTLWFVWILDTQTIKGYVIFEYLTNYRQLRGENQFSLATLTVETSTTNCSLHWTSCANFKIKILMLLEEMLVFMWSFLDLNFKICVCTSIFYNLNISSIKFPKFWQNQISMSHLFNSLKMMSRYI